MILVRSLSIIATLGLLLGSGTVSSAVILNPTPYLSEADSPFSTHLGDSDFYLETFEDGAMNTLGLSATAGSVLGPSSFTDSVDADDGAIDGSGNDGHSWWSNFAAMDIAFDDVALGFAPTHAGFVVTHTTGDVTFSFYDVNDVLIHQFLMNVPNPIVNGATDEDRFIGVIHGGGIGRIETTGNWEIDHIQYGMVIPVPAVLSLMGLGLLYLLGSRRN